MSNRHLTEKLKIKYELIGKKNNDIVIISIKISVSNKIKR